MEYNKKLLLIISLLSIVTLSIIYLPVQGTQAKTNNQIDITTIPDSSFFNVKNMAPGDKVTSVFTIKNDGNIDFYYDIIARYESGDEKLYHQLLLQVLDSKGIIYNGILSDFKNITPRFLDRSNEEELTFQVELPLDSGNEFQGMFTSIAFDFIAKGSEPANGSPEETQPNSPTSGGILPQTGEESPTLFYVTGMFLILAGIVALEIKNGRIKQLFKND